MQWASTVAIISFVLFCVLGSSNSMIKCRPDAIRPIFKSKGLAADSCGASCGAPRRAELPTELRAELRAKLHVKKNKKNNNYKM